MIHHFPNGNLFDTTADALVNPVNCVGFMGKGLALEFSKRFPEILEPYKGACASGQLRPGVLMLIHLEVQIERATVYTPRQFVLQEMEGMKVAEGIGTSSPSANQRFGPGQRLPQPKRPAIILFPTKDHWRFKSRVEWIEQGLATLRSCYCQWGLKSMAMPQLGCGLGGLDWTDVEPLVNRYFADEPVEVDLYLSAVKSFGEERGVSSREHSQLSYGPSSKR